MKYIISNPLQFGNPENNRSSIGHASYNWITSLIIAKLSGCEFIHTPFTHDCTRYEDFLGFGKSFKTKHELPHNNIHYFPTIDFSHNPNKSSDNEGHENFIKIKKQIDLSPDGSIFSFPMGTQFPGVLIKYSEFLCDILQKSYWEGKTNYYNSSKITVGIHIRRGDITEIGNPDRWKSNKYYREIIDNIKKQINCEVYIFSEGNDNDFKIFNDCILVLNGNDLDTFHGLASANILVTGQSTFSTLIAYINKGLIIYTPCLNFTRFEDFSSRFINYKNINNNTLKDVI